MGELRNEEVYVLYCHVMKPGNGQCHKAVASVDGRA